MFFSTQTLGAILAMATAASAANVPNYQGMTLQWADDFQGDSGNPVNSELWKTVNRNLGINKELQTYSMSQKNVQLSGGDTVQLVPWHDNGVWTSGRIESLKTVEPQAGKVTRVEASLRMGDNDAGTKQGIWPAFWLLGEAVRKGIDWPQCGELDIVEQKNGIATNFATAHCGQMPGGPCNEPMGKSAQTTMDGGSNFHTWALTIDLRQGDFKQQVITWYKDGAAFHTLTGAEMVDEGVWGTIAHSPLFVVLNVAVGGAFPGDPNGSTKDGYGAMMEVEYVAVYSS